MPKKNLADAFNERREKKESNTETSNPAVEQITQSHLPPSRRGKKTRRGLDFARGTQTPQTYSR